MTNDRRQTTNDVTTNDCCSNKIRLIPCPPGVVILMFLRRAHYDFDRKTCALDQRGFVGSEKAVRVCVIEGLLQNVIAKSLRSLRHHNAGARNRRFDDGSIGSSLHLFYSINRGPAGNCGMMFFRGLDYVGDNFLRDEWPNRIVDQHDVVGIGLRGCERAGDRILAMLAAFDDLQRLVQDFRVLLLKLRAKACNLVLAQGDDDLVNLRTGGKDAQGMNEDRNAAEMLELLGGSFRGRRRRHARAQSGCGDNDKYLHSGRSV